MKVQNQKEQTFSSAYYASTIDLSPFKIARFIFNLSAKEPGSLPEYKGGVLRGGFGYTFKDVACQNKKECGSCGNKSRCAYMYIFETPGTGADDKFSEYSDVQRPFVIDSSDARKCNFARGDPLRFGLTLVGKAIEYFPYFVFCFDELGRKGIGKGRIRFRLESIHGLDFQKNEWLPVYDPADHLLTENLPIASADQIPFKCNSALSLAFLTPTRIKYRDNYITDMEFHVMIRNLLRRVSMLMLFHCDEKLDLDFKSLVDHAKMVDVRSWDLRWFDWERYSTRQSTSMRLGGFTGNVTYEGDIEKFMPLVALGEYIHIGKNTTFGLGKYRICITPKL